jgi:hypothetical protein
MLNGLMDSEWKPSLRQTDLVRSYLDGLRGKCDWVDPGWKLTDGSNPSTKPHNGKERDDMSLIGVLLDLARYEEPTLMVKCLDLVNRIYGSENDLFQLAVQAQVLITGYSTNLAKHAKDNVPVIKAIAQGVITGQDDIEKFNSTVVYWTSKCYILGRDSNPSAVVFGPDRKSVEEGDWREPGLPNNVNQNIMLNSGIIPVLLDTVRTKNQPPSVLRNCFWLLRGLCVGFEPVQILLYEALDVILNTTTVIPDEGGTDTEIAAAQADETATEAWQNSLGWVVSEIFNACRETCLRVTPDQVEHMLTRIGAGSAEKTYRSARLLEALGAVSKVEEWNLPLKRNQALIMKFLWGQRDAVVDIACIDELSDPVVNKERLLLLSSDQHGAQQLKKTYHMNLVMVLAICCEGENRQIEAMCRSIFTLDELIITIAAPTHPAIQDRPFLAPTQVLLHAVKHLDLQAQQRALSIRYSGETPENQGISEFGATFAGIFHSTKAPYLSFFLWAYLNTEMTAVEIGTADLHSRNDLFEALAVMAVEEIGNVYSKLLNKGEEIDSVQATFVYDIFIPSMEKLADDHFPLAANTDGQSYFFVIADTLLDFLRPREGKTSSHMNRFRSNGAVRCITALTKRIAANKNYRNVDKLNRTLWDISKIALDFSAAGVSHNPMLKEYHDTYAYELVTNEEFNSFALNLNVAYQSENTVSAQLGSLRYYGVNSASLEPYLDNDGKKCSEKECEEASIDKLHCARHGGKGVLPLGIEFQYLVGLFCDFGEKKAVLNPDRLGVLVRLWEAHAVISASASAKDLEALNEVTIKSLELVLAACHNVTLSVEDATEKNVAEIVVQDQLVKAGAVLPVSFLMESNSYAVQQESLSALDSIIKGGNLQAQTIFQKHFLDTREETFFESVSALLNLAVESIAELRILAVQKDESDKEQDKLRSTMSGTIKDLKSSLQESGGTTRGGGIDDDVVIQNNQLELGSGSHGHFGMLLRVLQSMCEGNNKTIQDYFRQQPDNIKSFNLVTMISTALQTLVAEPAENVEMIVQCVYTLNEFTQGNVQNTRDIFVSDLTPF